LTYKEVRMDFFKEIKNPVKFLRHIDISGFLFHRGNEGCLGTRFLSDGNTITVKKHYDRRMTALSGVKSAIIQVEKWHYSSYDGRWMM